MDNRNAAHPLLLAQDFKGSVLLFSFLVSFAALVILSAGCGAPGEPIERKPHVPAAITDLAAVQQGNDVILTFTLPKETDERHPLKEIPAVEIYRDFVAPPAGTNATTVASPANPTLLVTIPSAMVNQYDTRGHMRYVDSLSPQNFEQHPGQLALYIVRTRASKKAASDNSNVVELRVQPAADAIADLKTEVTHQGVVLSWTPPQKTLTGSVPAVSTYRVFRSTPAPESQPVAKPDRAPLPIETPASKSGFVRIGELENPPFRDTQVEFGKTYTYSVRSVAQYPDVQVESSDSNIVTVTPRDIFPPAAPQGLLVVPVPAQKGQPGYLDLSWSIGQETDIAGYNVYRSDQEGTPENKLNQQLLLTPAFRDMNVVPGRHYFYTVTAVDRAGNESTASTAASGELPEEPAEAP
jgi:hypothetical protein